MPHMSREYWVGTVEDPELFGPYRTEQTARESLSEHQPIIEETLSITNSDDAY